MILSSDSILVSSITSVGVSSTKDISSVISSCKLVSSKESISKDTLSGASSVTVTSSCESSTEFSSLTLSEGKSKSPSAKILSISSKSILD